MVSAKVNRTNTSINESSIASNTASSLTDENGMDEEIVEAEDDLDGDFDDEDDLDDEGDEIDSEFDPEQIDPDQIDEIFRELKGLLSTVEKLQKARQDVGDIKPMLLRLLDGELLTEDELDQLKSGVSGLSKLVKLYSDYQIALDKAQPARALLDQVIKS